MRYSLRGVCARQVELEVENDIIKKVVFYGGCSGNTQGVARLCENRTVEEVVSLLEGISCGGKPTSCPDQLARVLKENYLNK